MQRETVRWVLGTPKRLGSLLDKGEKSEATKAWDEVRVVLEKWKGVKGVDELSEECERIMGRN